MQLVIGSLSTWSLRAWICGQLAAAEFELVTIDLSRQNYKAQVLKYSPTGLVPALLVDDMVIHDSLAIAEYLNECSQGGLYPSSSSDRALARSLCMEMHSGFTHLRRQCPFTLEKVARLTNLTQEIQQEVNRVTAIFTQARGPFMFEEAGAVDAFYAILAYRLQTYGIVLQGKALQYQQSLLNWPVLQQAIQLANALK